MKKAASILLTFTLILSSITVFSNYGYMSEDEEIITSITDEEAVCGYNDNADNAMLVLAYYSQDGRLLEARITNQAKTPDIDIDENNPDGYFKLFVLNSMSKLSSKTPLVPLYHSYYTYICSGEEQNGLVKLRSFDETGAKRLSGCENNVTLNGTSCNDVNAIIDSCVNKLTRLVRNSDGNIISIDNCLAAKSGWFKYSLSGNVFSNGSDSFSIDKNTIILFVPTDKTDYSNYSKRRLNNFRDNKLYHIDAYEISQNNSTAKCILMHEDSVIQPLWADSPILIYSYKNPALNSNWQQVHKVNGYLIGENENTPTNLKTKNSTDTTTFANSFTGDVYRVAYTNDDYNANTQKILSVSGKMESAFYENNNGYEMVHGLLYSATEEEFVIAKTHDVNAIEETEKYTFALDEDAVFITYKAYESDNYKLYATTDNRIMGIPSYEDSLSMPEYFSTSEVFTYAINGKTILVYEIIR